MSGWRDLPYWDTYFAVHRSRRYHELMSSFFEGCGNSIAILNGFLGVGAFAVLARDGAILAQTFIAIVGALTVIDRVMRFSKKANAHRELCKRFTKLAGEMERLQPNVVNLRKIDAKRLEIEEDEPSIKRLVDLRARNEQLMVTGGLSEDCAPLDWWQRSWASYFFTFGLHRLEVWRNNRYGRPRLPDQMQPHLAAQAQATPESTITPQQ